MKNTILLLCLISFMSAGQVAVPDEFISVNLYRPGSGELVWTDIVRVRQGVTVKPEIPSLDGDHFFVEFEYEDGTKSDRYNFRLGKHILL